MADSSTLPLDRIQEVFREIISNENDRTYLVNLFTALNPIYEPSGGYYTVTHGPTHIANVIENLAGLIKGINWNFVLEDNKSEIQKQYFRLFAAALIHDVGMFAVGIGGSTQFDASFYRKNHAKRDVITGVITNKYSILKNLKQYDEIIDIAWAHAKDDNFTAEQKMKQIYSDYENENTRLFVRLLRFADLLDIGPGRVPDLVKEAGIGLNDEQQKHYNKHCALNVIINPSAYPTSIRINLMPITRHKNPTFEEVKIFIQEKTAINEQLNELQTYCGNMFDGWNIKSNVKFSHIILYTLLEERNKNSTPPFLEKLEKHLVEILKKPLMKDFIKYVLKIMVNEGKFDAVIKDKLSDTKMKELIDSIGEDLDLEDNLENILMDNIVIDDISIKTIASFITGLGCLEAIILINNGYRMYKEQHVRAEKQELITLWKLCLELIEWLVLLTVDYKWVENKKAELGEKYLAVVVPIPVKTDIGCEIYFACLNERKAAFCKGQDGAIVGKEAVPIGPVPIHKTGWMCEDIVRHIVKEVYFYVEGVQIPSNEEEYDTARITLQSRLQVKKRTEKKSIYVVIKEWKLLGIPLDQVLKALTAALNTLDIGSIKSGQNLVESEAKLDAHIREFFTLKPTGDHNA